jgi:hypothetical protein
MNASNNKTKIQLPSRAKQSAMEQAISEEQRIHALAKKWVELHAKRKTRDQMDALLEGLPEPMQRKVYLLGQRLSAGLPYKIAQ